MFNAYVRVVRVIAYGVLGVCLLLVIQLLVGVVQVRGYREDLERAMLSVDSGRQSEHLSARQLLGIASAMSHRRQAVEAILAAEESLRAGDADALVKYLGLAFATLGVELSAKVQKLLLLLVILLALAIAIWFDLKLQRRINPLPLVIKELSRVNSGRVPLAISYHKEIQDDITTLLGYIKVLESKNWAAARRFADENAIPPLIERLKENLEDQGPVLDDVNTYLTALIKLCQQSPLAQQDDKSTGQ